MLRDIAQMNPQDLPLFDVVIVGAGAAGITLALELAGRGQTVCLLESGGEQFEAESQALCTSFDAGLPACGLTGRLRMLGGATNHWGGRTGTLDALDMAEKPWAPGTGWPITRDSLDPFYARARVYCGVDHQPSLDGMLRAAPAFVRSGTAQLQPYPWWITPHDAGTGRKFGRYFGAKLASSAQITLLTHANVTRFVMDGAGHAVAGVAVASLGGWRGTVRGRRFVVATGGIENSRLLLLGDGQRVLGGPMVGRYFLQHLRGSVGWAYSLPAGVELARSLRYDVLDGGDGVAVCEMGMQFSPAWRQKAGLLNAVATLKYQSTPGARAFRAMLTQLAAGRWISDLGGNMYDILSDSFFMGNLMHLARTRKLPWQAAEIVVDIEQLPQADSRITLADARDAMGVPLPLIAWRSHEAERRSFREMGMAMATGLAQAGLARCRLAPWVSDEKQPISNGAVATFHYSGGTRMAARPDAGVVDADCRVHGVANLYVAGSSVFPSIGHINPTLTIVALALRLGDHLGQRAGQPA